MQDQRKDIHEDSDVNFMKASQTKAIGYVLNIIVDEEVVICETLPRTLVRVRGNGRYRRASKPAPRTFYYSLLASSKSSQKPTSKILSENLEARKEREKDEVAVTEKKGELDIRNDCRQDQKPKFEQKQRQNCI